MFTRSLEGIFKVLKLIFVILKLALRNRIDSHYLVETIYIVIFQTGHEFLHQYLKTIESVKQQIELKNAESIAVHRFKPTLNGCLNLSWYI